MYGRITVGQAMLLVHTKFNAIEESLDEETKYYLERIMEGEKEYYEVERLIPMYLKEKLKP